MNPDAAPRATAIDRRTFLGQAALITAGTASPDFPGAARRSRTADVVLRGGLVYDGSGAPPFEADVAVTGDRISDVASGLPTAGALEIDVTGAAVAPGFIDIHSHTDLELFIDPRAESKVRQGVTTEIVGQDGGSMGPWVEADAMSLRERYSSSFGVELEFHDVAGFLRQLEREPAAVNVASMIGHGTVRGYVMGMADRPATEAELSQMAELIDRALRAGACGLSTGLEYVPGAFAEFDEIVRVAMPLKGTGLPYTSHMRNEDDQLLAAVEEALNVGRSVGIPVHLSHLKAQGQRNWWKGEVVLDVLRRARARGVDVTYDRYPYVAYQTGLASLFPVWARDGGTDAFLTRLSDAASAPRIERAVRDKIDRLGSWDAVQILTTGSRALAWTHGRRLGELAAERGEEPFQLLLQLIVDDRGRTDMIGFGMSEDNTARFLTDPLGMICSDGTARATDGPLAAALPHPRSFGTFPRVLGHYCRDRGLMPLETGIHKMTGMPAARLHLDGRGVLVPGAYADVVVFDREQIADRATFEQPRQYPVGVSHVLVNGTFVLRDGDHTGARPGRPLRGAAAG